MHILRKFTYPTFIGTCSLLATLSDILQNPFISGGLVIILIAIGLLCIILPQSTAGSLRLLAIVGFDSSLGVLRPFGVSCLMLAAIVFGFSTLSARSADTGGVIASSFPEIREMQITLGVVERQVEQIASQTAHIQETTDSLAQYAVQWVDLELEPSHVYFQDGTGSAKYRPADLFARITNNTGSIFEDVTLNVTSSGATIIDARYPVVPQRHSETASTSSESAYEVVAVCLSGKVRGKGEWLVERREYKIDTLDPKDSHQFLYSVTSATGPIVSKETTLCSEGE